MCVSVCVCEYLARYWHASHVVQPVSLLLGDQLCYLRLAQVPVVEHQHKLGPPCTQTHAHTHAH
jgi:hypothetical protein